MDHALNQYHAILTGLAKPALEAVGLDPARSPAQSSQAGGGQPQPSVLLGVSPARLLLEDRPDLYGALVDGARALAALTEAWQNKPAGELPRLTDTAGHSRDVYWLLVLHLHLAGFARHYESLSAGQWSACEQALSQAIEPARWIEAYAGVAPTGDRVAVVLWSALCVLEYALLAGRDVNVELVDTVVHHAIQPTAKDASSPLHPMQGQAQGEGSPSLDAWTYRELCGLHALANLALGRRNAAWAKRVEQVALYHLEHTQPDHVTTQPWGVFGFLWSPKTRVFVDQQLHDAMAQGRGGTAVKTHADTASGPLGARPNHAPQNRYTLEPIAGMLLADAAAAVGVLAP